MYKSKLKVAKTSEELFFFAKNDFDAEEGEIVELDTFLKNIVGENNFGEKFTKTFSQRSFVANTNCSIAKGEKIYLKNFLKNLRSGKTQEKKSSFFAKSEANYEKGDMIDFSKICKNAKSTQELSKLDILIAANKNFEIETGQEISFDDMNENIVVNYNNKVLKTKELENEFLELKKKLTINDKKFLFCNEIEAAGGLLQAILNVENCPISKI